MIPLIIKVVSIDLPLLWYDSLESSHADPAMVGRNDAIGVIDLPFTSISRVEWFCHRENPSILDLNPWIGDYLFLQSMSPIFRI